MKIVRIAIILAITMIIVGIIDSQNTTADRNRHVNTYIDKNSVSYNGKLRVEDEKILNAKGEEIQLTGISSHGIQWFGDLYTKDNIAQLKNELDINIFRVAMYTDPKANGYIADTSLKQKVYELVDASIALDIYVIIDWHILGDNNPQTYQQQAKEFFAEVSAKYADKPNVIYEICNEPNGNNVTWENNIYPYAKDIVATIREKTDALVIVGSGDWSKELGDVSKKPLEEKNIAYALHFYAGSHNKTLRDKIDDFREKKLAVFVSECGATDMTGDGKIYDEAFMRWVDYMHEKNISWLFWSYSNKKEGSSILEPGYVPDFSSGIMDDSLLDSHLSESGKLVKKAIIKYKEKDSDYAEATN
ncbi:MAG: glycoside hydrolase family 5 protein [Candidatus Saccharibacteria bacterium]|nr:glycoside hydrolase family 5 protein [Candidatus Saccharibacteria bacterium]